jgi:hypothetical protein
VIESTSSDDASVFSDFNEALTKLNENDEKMPKVF